MLDTMFCFSSRSSFSPHGFPPASQRASFLSAVAIQQSSPALCLAHQLRNGMCVISCSILSSSLGVFRFLIVSSIVLLRASLRPRHARMEPQQEHHACSSRALIRASRFKTDRVICLPPPRRAPQGKVRTSTRFTKSRCANSDQRRPHLLHVFEQWLEYRPSSRSTASNAPCTTPSWPSQMYSERRSWNLRVNGTAALPPRTR